MNDDFPIDPALQTLESRIFAIRPKLSAREEQELLYQCAFGAGRSAATRRMRRWQLASAALGVLLLSLSIPLMRERAPVAGRETAQLESAGLPVQTAHELPRSRIHVVLPLDAWQVQADTFAAFERALDKFKQKDATSRSLAVGAMLRSAGTP